MNEVSSLDYFASLFRVVEVQPLQNRYAAWELARTQQNHSIPQPALAVFPLNVI